MELPLNSNLTNIEEAMRYHRAPQSTIASEISILGVSFLVRRRSGAQPELRISANYSHSRGSAETALKCPYRTHGYMY